MGLSSCVAGVFLIIAPLLGGAAANWPQYRGLHANGLASDRGMPLEWSAAENIDWKVDLPGPGASSPIVWGDRIYVTCYSGYGVSAMQPGDQANLMRHVLCLDRSTGNTIWKYDAKAALPEEDYQGFLTEHGYASSTPATDGTTVFAFFGKSGLHALSLDGKLRWRADCGDKTHSFGSGTSPVLFKNLVIVNASVESGSLIAFDKATGKEVWRVPKIEDAWDTPILVDVAGRQELVLSQAGPVLGLDPATGRELWRCKGFDDYVCANVVAHAGVVYAMGDRTARQFFAIRAGGSGDVTKTHLLWTQNKAGNISAPVFHDGYLYFMHESLGVAYCLEAKTGKVMYEQRLTPRSGAFYASPVLVDGRIYAVSRDRGTFVIAPKPEFELLAHNDMAGDETIFNAAPAVSNGQLLIRSDRSLYCIGKK